MRRHCAGNVRKTSWPARVKTFFSWKLTGWNAEYGSSHRFLWLRILYRCLDSGFHLRYDRSYSITGAVMPENRLSGKDNNDDVAALVAAKLEFFAHFHRRINMMAIKQNEARVETERTRQFSDRWKSVGRKGSKINMACFRANYK